MAKHLTVDGLEPDAVTKAWLTRYFLDPVKGRSGERPAEHHRRGLRCPATGALVCIPWADDRPRPGIDPAQRRVANH